MTKVPNHQPDNLFTNDEWIGFRENLQETIDFEDFDIK